MKYVLVKQKLFSRYVAEVLPPIISTLINLRLRNLKFSLVSNNCWGAHVYQRAAIPYTTPFVGVALSPSSYLDLLENWDLLRAPLFFSKSSLDDSIERVR
jgi:uncharacterized protein (DUF1919 family)